MGAYFSTMQREDGRWIFTVHYSRGYPVPTGYCHAFMPISIDQFAMFNPFYIEEHNKHEAMYHTDGHATAAEATACYRQYLLDHKSTIGLIRRDTMKPCIVCGMFTDLYAECDQQQWSLCEKHNNQGTVDTLFEFEPGDELLVW